MPDILPKRRNMRQHAACLKIGSCGKLQRDGAEAEQSQARARHTAPSPSHTSWTSQAAAHHRRVLWCAYTILMKATGEGGLTHIAARKHTSPQGGRSFQALHIIGKNTHHAYRNTRVTLDLGGIAKNVRSKRNIADVEFCVFYFSFNMF